MSRDLKRHQHLDPHRKYLLRKHLLKWALDGPVYVPFIGDGDIAAGGSKPGALAHEKYGLPGLYTDRFVYGADLDKARVAVARARIPNGLIRVADCDDWPFRDVQTGPIAVCDFDAFAEPWPSFRSFWAEAEKADRIVLFFTDAHRMGIAVDGTLIKPDGSKETFRPGIDAAARSAAFNFYLHRTVWPWMTDFIRPYRIVTKMRYLRGMLTYHGLVVEQPTMNGGRMAGKGKLSNFGGKKAAPFAKGGGRKSSSKSSAKKGK